MSTVETIAADSVTSDPIWRARTFAEKNYRFKALTRGVSVNMNACELTYRCREEIDRVRAEMQLQQYCQLLRQWNVDVVPLPGSPSHPDSCFVQDTAIVLDEVCVVASMGAVARRGETDDVEQLLSDYRTLRRIFLPATLDGGDVVQIGRRLFVGLSTRTNVQGHRALREIVEPLGYEVVPVAVSGGLHLTTACGVVNDETVILNPCWLDANAFTGLRRLQVPETEPWAANTIRINEHVCLEAGAPRTFDLVHPYAGNVETLDISEFRKAEGSLSCLSIIFREVLQLS